MTLTPVEPIGTSSTSGRCARCVTTAGGRVRETAIRSGLPLAQAGEFGFVLVGFARSEGILGLAQGQITLLVISLSMLLTPG